MFNVKNEFVDKKGNIYNIRNINYECQADLSSNMGHFITETENSDPLYTDRGVYLYKSYYDPKKALRFYKDCAMYKYTHHSDAEMIAKLQERQKDIKLTEFPTGIITIENYEVGQEIVFYENYKTLLQEIKEIKNKEDIFKIYLKIFDILKELLDNGICYSDIHYRNFMINNNDVKLIDFEKVFVKIDYSDYDYESMMNNLRTMINVVNEMLYIDFKVNNCKTIEDVEKEILIKSKKIM